MQSIARAHLSLKNFRQELARCASATEVEDLIDRHDLQTGLPAHRKYWREVLQDSPFLNKALVEILTVALNEVQTTLAARDLSHLACHASRQIISLLEEDSRSDDRKLEGGSRTETESTPLYTFSRHKRLEELRSLSLKGYVSEEEIERIFLLLSQQKESKEWTDNEKWTLLHSVLSFSQRSEAHLARLLEIWGDQALLCLSVSSNRACTPALWRKLIERAPAQEGKGDYYGSLMATIEGVDSDLAYGDPYIRERLLRYGAGNSIHILRRSAEHAEGPEFAALFREIVSRYPRQASELLIQPRIRQEQLCALSDTDLLPLLQHKDSRVRLRAIRTLPTIGKSEELTSGQRTPTPINPSRTR